MPNAFFIAQMAMVALLAMPAFANLVAVNDNSSCAWDGRKDAPPTCWPALKPAQDEIRAKIRNVIDLQGENGHFCAVYVDDKLRRKLACWGTSSEYDSKLDPKTQKLGDIHYLAVGRNHLCVLHELEPGKRVPYCWGNEEEGKTVVPKDLEFPTTIFASRESGENFTCVRHKKGSIRCWGDLNGEFPAEKFPQISTGLNLQCRKLSDTDVDCWENQPGRNAPNVRLERKEQICTLGEKGLQCKKRSGEKIRVPFNFKHPRELAVGISHSCVLDDKGAWCWGSNHNKQCDIPVKDLVFGPTLQDFGNVTTFLDTLSEFVYRHDASYLQKMRAIIPDKDRMAGAFVINALRPFLVEMGYRTLKEEYILGAISVLDSLNRQLKVEKIVDIQLPGQQKTKMLREMMAITIVTSLNLLTPEDRTLAVNVLNEMDAEMDDAIPAPEISEKLKSLFKQLRNHPYLANRMLAAEVMLLALVP